ncbi:hypothetical protein DPMN_048079 [Dreissena polymorpha]|uniref:Uncharacterized protein n=1 Tax=Dreissena polymorpha TaxID=45954 RepID=A0A9D4I209_DREPO|nr:hypothetical protein DPMN_048079 [Dreissena polymorpha]
MRQCVVLRQENVQEWTTFLPSELIKHRGEATTVAFTTLCQQIWEESPRSGPSIWSYP